MALIEKAFQEGKSGRHGAGDTTAPPRGLRQFDLPLSSLRDRGFFCPSDAPSRLDLELRLLKRRLLRRTGMLHRQYATETLARRGNRRKNLIMVTSTRPNEGKTFVSMNLALSLALEDELNVLLVDSDFPRPKLRGQFDLPELPGFSDMILDRSLAPEAVCLQARGTSLRVLVDGEMVNRSGDILGSAEAKQTLNVLSQWQDNQLVILDAPPVLATTEAVLLAPHVDEILFVVEADATPEQAIASALEELLDVNKNISLVLNKCLIGAGGSHYGSYAEYYPRSARREEIAANTPPGQRRRFKGE